MAQPSGQAGIINSIHTGTNLSPVKTASQKALKLARRGADVDKIADHFNQDAQLTRSNSKKLAEFYIQVAKREEFEYSCAMGLICGLVGQYLSGSIGFNACALSTALITMAGLSFPFIAKNTNQNTAAVATGILCSPSLLLLPKDSIGILVTSTFCGTRIIPITNQYTKNITAVAVASGIVSAFTGFALSTIVSYTTA